MARRVPVLDEITATECHSTRNHCLLRPRQGLPSSSEHEGRSECALSSMWQRGRCWRRATSELGVQGPRVPSLQGHDVHASRKGTRTTTPTESCTHIRMQCRKVFPALVLAQHTDDTVIIYALLAWCPSPHPGCTADLAGGTPGEVAPCAWARFT